MEGVGGLGIETCGGGEAGGLGKRDNYFFYYQTKNIITLTKTEFKSFFNQQFAMLRSSDKMHYFFPSIH